jgi:hypothetical protein
MYSTRPFHDLLTNKKELVFIHTPKCAGTYVSSILSQLNIKNNRHNQATPNDNCIYFTVIRNPVERFESMLNYRLGLPPKNDWPTHLLYVYDDTTIQLDEIVSKMSDTEMISFSCYNTLQYWTTNVDIIITLDHLPKLLEYFGYSYDIHSFSTKNVSTKLRGKLNQENKDRIKKMFKDDVELYNKILNSVF